MTERELEQQRKHDAFVTAALLQGRPMCRICQKNPVASKGDGKWRADCAWCRLRRQGRTRVGIRHKDQCQACGLGFSHPAFFDVDHKVQFAKGGSNAPENLWTLCPNCHRVKTLVERGLLPDSSTEPSAWRAS
jgi:5-methylcytosine-specific restriction protein A